MEENSVDSASVAARLSALLSHYEVTGYQAAQILGHSHASKLYKLLNGESRPSFESLVQILGQWPEVSADWLLMGRGPMLRPGTTSDDTAKALPEPVSSSSEVLVLSDERRQELLAQLTPKDNILHFSLRAQAGYTQITSLDDLLDEVTAFSLPMFARGEYRAFDVSGNSMMPTFSHADMVICKEVTDRRNMLPGHCYVVVLTDNVLVKRINQQVRDTDETITLHSDNAAYSPMEVTRDDVRELWQVKAFLSGNIPTGGKQIKARLRELLEAIGPESDVLREYAAEQAGGV